MNRDFRHINFDPLLYACRGRALRWRINVVISPYIRELLSTLLDRGEEARL